MTDTTTAHAEAIGARVRALRGERGLSMRDLAGRAGVSQPFVSKLEAGHQLPSVPTVYALAAALGTTPGLLLAPGDGAGGSDVHLPLTEGEDAPSVRVIGTPGGRTQVFLLDLAPGQGDGGFVSHSGEELLIVLEGSAVSSERGREDEVIAAGGSRVVDPSVPHGLRASSAGPARVLLVCTEAGARG